MSFEALVLAVVCAVRPTALASVYALLASSTPERPLAAYTAAGFASSLIAGAVVVLALHGVGLETGTSTVYAAIELAGGAAALGFAAGIATGRVQAVSGRKPSKGDSRLVKHLRNPSLRVAAGAGVATHLPGLLYLLGLNAIAAGEPSVVGGLAEVLVFDAIWLAIPIGALVLSIRSPETARAAVGRVAAWMRSHERPALLTVFILVGAYFTTKGALDLLG